MNAVATAENLNQTTWKMDCNVIESAYDGIDKYVAVFDYPNTKIKPKSILRPVDENLNPIAPPPLNNIT